MHPSSSGYNLPFHHLRCHRQLAIPSPADVLVSEYLSARPVLRMPLPPSPSTTHDPLGLGCRDDLLPALPRLVSFPQSPFEPGQTPHPLCASTFLSLLHRPDLGFFFLPSFPSSLSSSWVSHAKHTNTAVAFADRPPLRADRVRPWRQSRRASSPSSSRCNDTLLVTSRRELRYRQNGLRNEYGGEGGQGPKRGD